MAIIDHTQFSETAADTSDGLTRVMVLHPVACALAFIAFFISLGAGVVGSLVGAIVGFVAWVLVLVSLAVDFTLFGVVKNHVNRDGSGSHAYYGLGLWLLLVSTLRSYRALTCHANMQTGKLHHPVLRHDHRLLHVLQCTPREEARHRYVKA